MINRRRRMLITSGLGKDVTQVKNKYFFTLWVDRKKVNTLSNVESEANSELEVR